MGLEPDKQIPKDIRLEAPWPPREVEPVKETLPPEEASRPAEIAEPSAPAVVVPDEPVVEELSVKTELQIEIENVLSDDLEDIFWGLPPTDRAAFKERGEETAGKIRELLSQTSVRIQDIFRLIVEWLKSLPGVSSMFVEQEAKNKADRILKLHH